MMPYCESRWEHWLAIVATAAFLLCGALAFVLSMVVAIWMLCRQ